jgi:gliding motility-associated-like protein
LSGFILNVDYKGVPYTASDNVGIEVCDFTSLCTTQDIEIELAADIVVYNAVSPNGDNKNDFFFLEYIDVIPATKENKVTIYNRWGEKVFSVSNYNNVERRFEGLNDNGNKLPSGIYFYRISFVEGKREGWLELKH